MEIVLAKTAGFCYGVNRAVELAENQKTDDRKTVTLGPLIHNPSVVENLKAKGIFCVNQEEDIEKESRVIVRTHGVSKEILNNLQAKNCEIVDATCPFVKKIHNYVEKYSKISYNIIVTGYKNHPEVDGILGWCENAQVVSTTEEAKKLNLSGKVLVVSQTTFEKELFEEITSVIKEKYPDAEIIDTICSATAERQEETHSLSKECDMFVVIGGKNSSNTNRLYDIASKYCKKVVLVEDASEINTKDFKDAQKIGVTAGASTPAYIIKEVIHMLEEKELNFEESLLELEKIVKDLESKYNVPVLGLNLEMLNCDRRQFFDAMIAENVCPQVHYLPQTGMQEFHKQYGLWIFRCATGTTPADYYYHCRLRYFEFFSIFL